MDFLKIFKKEKSLSSIEFEKADIAYQVCELGRVFGCIEVSLEKCNITMDEEKQEHEGNIVMSDVKQYITYLQILLKRLGKDGAKVIGDSAEMGEFITYFINIEQPQSSHDIKLLQKKLEQWQNLTLCELRASSIHLCNVFSFCYGLRTMQFQLVNEIQPQKIIDILETNIQNIEKLEKGDKVLTSPNLKISKQNLRIMKFRLNEFKKHFTRIRKGATKDPKLYESIVNDRAEFTESIIFDIKKPSDYLSIFRRTMNNLIPLFVCYYLVAIPLVLLIKYGIIDKVDKIVVFITTGIVPAFLSFLWWTFHGIRDRLIISSFNFKRKQYFK